MDSSKSLICGQPSEVMTLYYYCVHNFKQTNKSETAGDCIMIKIIQITEQWVTPPAEHSIWVFFYIAAVPSRRGYLGFGSIVFLHSSVAHRAALLLVQKVHLQRTSCTVCFLSVHRDFTVIRKSNTFAICVVHNKHNKSLLINVVSLGSVIY